MKKIVIVCLFQAILLQADPVEDLSDRSNTTDPLSTHRTMFSDDQMQALRDNPMLRKPPTPKVESGKQFLQSDKSLNIQAKTQQPIDPAETARKKQISEINRKLGQNIQKITETLSDYDNETTDQGKQELTTKLKKDRDSLENQLNNIKNKEGIRNIKQAEAALSRANATLNPQEIAPQEKDTQSLSSHNEQQPQEQMQNTFKSIIDETATNNNNEFDDAKSSEQENIDNLDREATSEAASVSPSKILSIKEKNWHQELAEWLLPHSPDWLKPWLQEHITNQALNRFGENKSTAYKSILSDLQKQFQNKVNKLKKQHFLLDYHRTDAINKVDDEFNTLKNKYIATFSDNSISPANFQLNH